MGTSSFTRLAFCRSMRSIGSKTRGNLTDEEERLLTHLLTDLRMRFVEASRAPNP